jgi:hypothetical protein
MELAWLAALAPAIMYGASRANDRTSITSV